jgi:bifunctional non-homologous end joining protein LigD
VAKRDKGKVYFDYLQIGEGKTISAPYVLRAYDGAPVSTPLEWKEVKPGLTPSKFHIGNAVKRFARVGDLFEGVLKKGQKLKRPRRSWSLCCAEPARERRNSDEKL